MEAYFTMLTGFRPWDDEGSLMLSVKQYLGGMRLYEEVFSVYGPIYYFYNALTRAVTSTPVTHDVTRISSVFPWIACSLLCGWITLRLTRSAVFAALNITAVSMTLHFFRAEPGHPQELTLLILILIAACPLFADIERRPLRLMAIMGFLVGAEFLIKVNIGAYILAALILAIISEFPETRLRRLLGYAAGAGCILLPRRLCGTTWTPPGRRPTAFW
jgi:4-amino-4-deoxy-L-arabinose transferase-like glycosyltransferase